MSRPTTGRARVLLFAVTMAVVAGTGVMLERSMASVDRAQRLRHQLVAERLFDDMERQLSTLIDTEEARPFLHWNYGYVPELVEGNDATLLVSPLAALSEEGFRVGYFQYNPDGSMVTPHNPGQLELSTQIKTIEEELAAVTAGLEGWGEWGTRAEPRSMMVKVTVPAPKAQQIVHADFDLPIDNSMNRAVQQRAVRVPQQQSVQMVQAANFADFPVLPQQPPRPGGTQETSTPSKTPAPREVWVPVELPADPEPGNVDVVVAPYTVQSAADGQIIVMHRVVRIDKRSWVQGLALRRDGLQDELAQRVLADNPIAPYVALSWSGPMTGSDFAYDHDFAEPFGMLHAAVGLTALPESGMAPGTVLMGVTGLLVAVTLFGLIAVYRMVAVTLAFADQRSNFVAAVTHELKSPLTSIRMYSEMLEAGMVPDEDQRQEYYMTIRAESERLARLVDDVLTFSNIERGVPGPDGEVGTVGLVVDEVVRMMGPQAEVCGAVLVVWVDEAARNVQVDRDALSRVLVNLVDNALKFSAEAEERSIRVEGRIRGERVVLTVRDHGPGVPVALLGRVFEPFMRGERELVRKTRGTGIGLALVESLVARMDGAVEVRNHPQGGLEVTVSVPVQLGHVSG